MVGAEPQPAVPCYGAHVLAVGITPHSLVSLALVVACLGEALCPDAAAVPLRIRARSAIQVHVERSADGLVLRGALTDDTDEPLARESVLAAVEGLEPRTVRTGPAGEFELFIIERDALALAARVGDQIPWTVRYEGGASYGPAAADGLLHLEHDPTRIALELDPPGASIDGEAIAIRVLIEGPAGPVDRAEIRVAVADGPELIGETDHAGRVTFLLRPDDLVRAGMFRISARYVGDLRFAPSEAHATLRVLRGTRITLRVGREGDLHTGRYRFSGRVIDDRGPLAGVTVAIIARDLDGEARSRDGDARSQTLAVTDDDGVYIVAVEAREMIGRAGGVIEARAAFQPTEDRHSPAVSRAARIPVPGPPGVPLGWYVASIAASVGLVLLALAVRLRFWQEIARAWAAWRLSRRRRAHALEEAPVVVQLAVGDDLRTDWIAGRIVDAHTGRGVRGARCVLTGSGDPVIAGCDPHGRFAVGPLPGGIWRLELQGPEHMPRQMALTMPHDGSLDGATLALISVRGRVRDVYSRALSEYEVEVVWGRDTPAEALADAQGVAAADEETLGDLRGLVEETWFGPEAPKITAAARADLLRERLTPRVPAP